MGIKKDFFFDIPFSAAGGVLYVGIETDGFQFDTVMCIKTDGFQFDTVMYVWSMEKTGWY